MVLNHEQVYLCLIERESLKDSTVIPKLSQNQLIIPHSERTGGVAVICPRQGLTRHHLTISVICGLTSHTY